MKKTDCQGCSIAKRCVGKNLVLKSFFIEQISYFLLQPFLTLKIFPWWLQAELWKGKACARISIWHEKYFLLIWKAFENTEEWRFSFWHIFLRFSIMQIISVMTSYCLQLKMVKYWINDISGNIQAVFLKLGTINLHHKRKKWCCHSNSFGSSLFLSKKQISPFATPEMRQAGCYMYLEQTQFPYCLNSHQ